jgi:hypothetical protein
VPARRLVHHVVVDQARQVKQLDDDPVRAVGKVGSEAALTGDVRDDPVRRGAEQLSGTAPEATANGVAGGRRDGGRLGVRLRRGLQLVR